MRNGQCQGRLISFLKNIDQMRYELNHISRICTKPFLTLLMSMHGFFFYGRFISVLFINLLLILFYQYAVLFALAIHVSLTIPVQCPGSQIDLITRVCRYKTPEVHGDSPGSVLGELVTPSNLGACYVHTFMIECHITDTMVESHPLYLTRSLQLNLRVGPLLFSI